MKLIDQRRPSEPFNFNSNVFCSKLGAKHFGAAKVCFKFSFV